MRIKLVLSVGSMGLLVSGCLGGGNPDGAGRETPKSAPAARPGRRTVAWDAAALLAVPKVHATRECPSPPMRGFFYEGAQYKGRPTRVFAYYAAPEGQPPAGGWPAVVCAHGGGGTAYPAWVKQWNDHGYAAISMDMEGHLPDKRGHKDAGPARRYWENAACEIGRNDVTSRLPKGATVFYFNVKDKDGNLVSSVFVEVKTP